MDDPLRVHAEALADLDRQIARKRNALDKARYATAVDRRDMAAAVRAAEGRKRILQRHAPVRIETKTLPRYACASHGYEWAACDDWRDAAGQETPE